MREILDNSKLSYEGTIPFAVYGETFDTWYKIFGDIPTATKPPLVILHGGPGISHDYLIPFKDLATPDRPVIFYDQLGTGRSTHAADKPASFWKIDLLLDELENLLSHFKIQDNFDIVGHSWGGMMACEFIIRRSPPGLKHLVLTNSLAVMASWAKSNAEILKDYPQWVQDGMKVGYADIPRLREAAKVVFADHSCRLKPQPPELWYALDQSLENTHVYTSL
jgi:proline-specific peptidase